MIPIINTLLNAGPSLIRLFGDSQNDTCKTIAHTIADVVSRMPSKPSLSDQTKLKSLLDSFDPEDIKILQLGLATIASERENHRFNYDLAMHEAQQKTLKSIDIKGIRPEIANRHSWFTVGYIVIAELLQTLGFSTGANQEIVLAIAAPTLAWFGFRTWDKFSKQGASQ